MANLFQLDKFTLASGVESSWKIECDALTDEDWDALAAMVAMTVRPFGSVEGVPTGGLKLAKAMEKYICPLTSMRPFPHLIVDDVLTTSGSMERLKTERFGLGRHLTTVIGAVVFARGQCPYWVRPLFHMPEVLWPKPRTRS